MGILTGPDRLGLWPNADLRANVDGFSMGTWVPNGGPGGAPYVKITGGGGGGFTGPRIEVDTSKSSISCGDNALPRHEFICFMIFAVS